MRKEDDFIFSDITELALRIYIIEALKILYGLEWNYKI